MSIYESEASTGTRANILEREQFDRIFVGGGLSSLMNAYATLKKAQEQGTKLNALIITEGINAPCSAGSHIDPGMEGMMADDLPNRDIISEMIRRDGRDMLLQTIEEEGIDCRSVQGYEIKGKTEKELRDFLEEVQSKGVYKAEEVRINTNDQAFHLPGYPHSAYTEIMGQVNAPELLDGIVGAIRRMGGVILEDTTYIKHKFNELGYCDVTTNRGIFSTNYVPFLGTGAAHQVTLGDFTCKTDTYYTGALVMGPLDNEDRIKIAKTAMAICDVNLDEDVLWGGIDPKGMLTIGKGELSSPDEIPALKEWLMETADGFFPGITKKYPPAFFSGPLLTAENKMPIVGRLSDCDIAGAWYGIGILPAMAAAVAFADDFVRNDDSRLKLWESMQPSAFGPKGPAAP